METNGKNAHQKILSLLVALGAETSSTVKVDTIARQVNISYHTARKALTDLKNAGLVAETNGFWSITPEGKEQYATNPNFSLKFLFKPATERRENWAELLGPEVIDSVLGRVILQEIPQELWDRLIPFLRYLGLAWLVAEGITVEYNMLAEVHKDADNSPAAVVSSILQDLTDKTNT